LSGKRASRDYRDLSACEKIHPIEILLPHHLHTPVALDAICAGQYVALQEPMTLSLPEADAVIASAHAAKAPLGRR